MFRFVAPMSAGYTIAARNPGTANVSNSTQFIDGATCMPIAGCAGLIGRRYSTRGVRHSATFLAEPQQQGSSLPT